MNSVHIYQAEKKDFQEVFDLLINFKDFQTGHLIGTGRLIGTYRNLGLYGTFNRDFLKPRQTGCLIE